MKFDHKDYFPKVIADGAECPFEVVAAEQKTKDGKDYIKVVLKALTPDQKVVTLDTILMFVNQLGDFCYATGLEDKFLKDEITAEDCLKREGKFIAGVKVDGPYTKNIVKKWVKRKVSTATESKAANLELNDDVSW